MRDSQAVYTSWKKLLTFIRLQHFLDTPSRSLPHTLKSAWFLLCWYWGQSYLKEKIYAGNILKHQIKAFTTAEICYLGSGKPQRLGVR